VKKRKTAAQLEREINAVLRTRSARAHASKHKTKKTPHEIKTKRLKALQGAMAAAEGDDAWEDTDLATLEGWISVDALTDDLSDVAWQRVAMKQLQDQSVLPEHVGAPPASVYEWNNTFIGTYRMNIDSGMSREDAIDSARQNAHDTVKLTGGEHHQVKSDPKLYGED
jgi:hypothetical protein